MQTLIDWTAKRAGGAITINGTDKQTGQRRKIVGVDHITAGRGGQPPVAVDQNGHAYILA